MTRILTFRAFFVDPTAASDLGWLILKNLDGYARTLPKTAIPFGCGRENHRHPAGAHANALGNRTRRVASPSAPDGCGAPLQANALGYRTRRVAEISAPVGAGSGVARTRLLVCGTRSSLHVAP